MTPPVKPEKSLYEKWLESQQNQPAPTPLEQAGLGQGSQPLAPPADLYERFLKTAPTLKPEFAPRRGEEGYNALTDRPLMVGLRSIGRRILPSIGQTMQSVGETAAMPKLRDIGASLEVATTRRPLAIRPAQAEGQALRMFGEDGNVVARRPSGDMDWGSTLQNVGDWTGFQVGNVGGSMIPVVGGTLVGGLVGGPVGAVAGGIAGGASLNIGESRTGMIEKGVAPERVGPASLATGAGMAVLDRIVPGRVAGRLGGAGAKAAAAKAAEAGLNPALRRIRGETIRDAAGELLTEGGQTVVQEVGTYSALGRMPTAAEAKEALYEIAESALAGGVGGGAAGAGSSTFSEARSAWGRPSQKAKAPGAGQRGDASGSPPPEGGVRRRVAEILDPSIKDVVEQRDAARRAAETDDLTGLGNQGAYSRAKASAEADAGASIVRFDLNGFKGVNDKLGHQKGDDVLRTVAQKMQEVAEQFPGTRIFRAGGDEFAVITRPEHAEAVRDAVEAGVGVQDIAEGVRVSISGGIGATDAEADQSAIQRKAEQKSAQGIAPRSVEEMLTESQGEITPEIEAAMAREPEQVSPGQAPHGWLYPSRPGTRLPLSQGDLETIADLERQHQILLAEAQAAASDPERLEAIESQIEQIVEATGQILSSEKYETAQGVPYSVVKDSPVADYEKQYLDFIQGQGGGEGGVGVPRGTPPTQTDFSVVDGQFPRVQEAGIVPPPQLQMAGQSEGGREGATWARMKYLELADQVLAFVPQLTKADFLHTWVGLHRPELGVQIDEGAREEFTTLVPEVLAVMDQVGEMFGEDVKIDLWNQLGAQVDGTVFGMEGAILDPASYEPVLDGEEAPGPSPETEVEPDRGTESEIEGELDTEADPSQDEQGPAEEGTVAHIAAKKKEREEREEEARRREAARIEEGSATPIGEPISELVDVGDVVVDEQGESSTVIAADEDVVVVQPKGAEAEGEAEAMTWADLEDSQITVEAADDSQDGDDDGEGPGGSGGIEGGDTPSAAPVPALPQDREGTELDPGEAGGISTELQPVGGGELDSSGESVQADSGSDEADVMGEGPVSGESAERSAPESDAGDSAATGATAGGERAGGGDPSASSDPRINGELDRTPPPEDGGVGVRLGPGELQSLIPRGQKSRARHNIRVIQTIRTLRAEGRQATDAEKKILLGYVGWGGIPGIFDPKNRELAAERAELRELLDDAQWDAAKRSTLNAHYTSEDVVRGVYSIIARLGLHRGSKALEPSAGIGHFLTMSPASLGIGQWSAIELDPLTGAILEYLHPDQDVRIQGYQDFKGRENTFDLVVGNVPFGDYGISDRKYDALKLKVHNYFIAKALDQLRPGGILAVVTSAGTLDARSSQKFREHLNAGAWFLGAIRLPSAAFRASSGTDVVTDIVVLQKKVGGLSAPQPLGWTRSMPMAMPDGSSVNVNEYFHAHPEMVVGTISNTGTLYRGGMMSVEMPSEASLVAEIRARAELLPENVVPAREPKTPGTDQEKVDESELPAVASKSLEVSLREGEVGWDEEAGSFFIKSGGALEAFPVAASRAERVRDYLGIRDAYRHALGVQRADRSDAEIKDAIDALKAAYDAAVAKHGPITLERETKSGIITMPNLMGLPSSGSDRALLSSLETPRRRGKKTTYEPSKALTDRILVPRVIAKPTDPQSAMVASVAEHGRVDLVWIGEQLGLSPEAVRQGLGDAVLLNPATGEFEPRERLLSGDILEKLKVADAVLDSGSDGLWSEEVERSKKALLEAMPKPLEASEIVAQPNAPFVPEHVVAWFFNRLFKFTPDVRYLEPNAKWVIEVPDGARRSSESTIEWGTLRVPGTDLFKKMMDGTKVVVHDTVRGHDGRERKVKNIEETLKATSKLDAMKAAWESALRDNPDVAKEVAQSFNDRMSRFVLPDNDGSALDLPGTSQFYKGREFSWERHQKDGIARILANRSTLLAWAVGAGKTFAIAGGFMEGRRTGKFQKPMYVVPKHLVAQAASEWQTLYPEARILVADSESVSKASRQAFMARATNGDWDVIIISHNSFSRIGMNPDFVRSALSSELQGVEEAIRAERLASGKTSSESVKSLESAKLRAEKRMQEMISAFEKDELLSFEEMGIDAIAVDEADLFKNLWAYSRRPEVQVNFTARAFDLFLKTQYLHQTKGTIVFATGTPVSNALYEVFAAQRYLQPDVLKKMGVGTLDAWLDAFSQIVERTELNPEGGRYRVMQRIAKYSNLGALMGAFGQVADVKMADDLWPEPTAEQVAAGFKRKRPLIKGGKMKMNSLPGTALTKSYIRHLGRRADAIRAKRVEPEEDNMLKVTSEGRKLALDPRLLDPRAAKPEDGVISRAADRITAIYRETDSLRGTQLVFSDLGVPRSATDKRRVQETARRRADKEMELTDKGMDPSEIAEKLEELFGPSGDSDGVEYADEGMFNVYDELRRELESRGIPATEIAYIHDANTDKRKADLFAKVNAGTVRVLIGSTEKMGAGTNVQERMVGLHHLDVPWRPRDIEQRNGRGIRQGNVLWNAGEIDGLYLEAYATEGTFATFMWDTNERKAGFIGQLWSGAAGNEIDEVSGSMELTAAEMKAVASGNPLALEVAGLKQEVAAKKQKVISGRTSAQNAVRRRDQYSIVIKDTKKVIAAREQDGKAWKDTSGDNFKITIGKKTFTDRAEAAAALDKLVSSIKGEARAQIGFGAVSLPVGTIGGLPLTLSAQKTIQGEVDVLAHVTGPSGTEYEGSANTGMGVLQSMERVGRGLGDVSHHTEKVQRLEAEVENLQRLAGVDISQEEEALSQLEQQLADKQAEMEAAGEGDDTEYVPTIPERSTEWWAAVNAGEIPYTKQKKGDGAQVLFGISDPVTGLLQMFSLKARRARQHQKDIDAILKIVDLDDVRERLNKADGVLGQSKIAKIREALGRWKTGLRHFEWLDEKASALNAQLYDILLRVERAPQAAKSQAFNIISRVTADLDKDDVKLLSVWMVLDDIKKDVESGLLTGEDLTAFYGIPDEQALDRFLENAVREAAQNPKLAKARETRDKMIGAITHDLVKHDLLPEAVLLDPRYFHRQVLTYFSLTEDDSVWQASLLGAGSRRVEVGKKGYQKGRSGVEEGSDVKRDFNIRYTEAEFEWLSQALKQLEITKALARIEGLADLRRDLAAQAKQINRTAWQDKVAAAIRSQMEKARKSEAEILQAIKDADPTKPFRIRKAIGFRRMAAGIYSGDISLPPRFDGFMMSLLEHTAGGGDMKGFHHPDLWRVIAHLAEEGDGTGAFAARMIFKAIGDEERANKQALGSAYIDKRNPSDLLKLAPEGYALWQPVKGNYFFRSVSIEQRIVDEVLSGERAFQSEDLRSVLAVGGPRETWIIPADLAAQLDKFSEARERGPLERIFRPLTKRWKWYALHAPHKVAKYMGNNVASDADAAALYPKILTHYAARAASDLYKLSGAGVGKADPKLVAEIESLSYMGVIGNTLTVTELPEVSQLPEFSHLVKSNPLEQMNIFGRYVHLVELVNQVRENTLRLAAYRFALDEMKSGNMLYGASDQKVIGHIAKIEERAAMFARDLLGDYQAVSRAGRALAEGPMPFFRWIEINNKRYVNLARNVKVEGGLRYSAVLGAAGARATVFTAVQAARVAALSSAFLVMKELYHRLFWDEEDELLRRQGIQGRVIVGRTASGDIISVRGESAFADFLGWVGLEDPIGLARSVGDGSLSPGDALSDALWQPVNRVYGAYEPFTKEVFEQFLGARAWPDIRDPRPIREKGVVAGAANIFGLQKTYRQATGRPVPSGVDPLSWVAYRTDAAEASYYATRDIVRRYRTETGRQDSNAPPPTDRSNALYYYRTAIRYGDGDAARRWLREYYALGGTREGATRSVQSTTHPLSGVPLSERDRFQRWLTPDERALVRSAIGYWSRTYSRETPPNERSMGVRR